MGAHYIRAVGLLSCLAIGLAFLVAVGLLVFAGVLLGWCVPAAVARARGAAPPSGGGDSGPTTDADTSAPAETGPRRGS
jgi:hypothetical protein